MFAEPRTDAATVRRFSRATAELKVVLLEGVHDTAVQALEEGGFSHVERHAKALEGDALLEAVRGAVMSSPCMCPRPSRPGP